MKMEKENKYCEHGDTMLLSNPPQYRCIKCQNTWWCSDSTPICKKENKTRANGIGAAKVNGERIYEENNSPLDRKISLDFPPVDTFTSLSDKRERDINGYPHDDVKECFKKLKAIIDPRPHDKDNCAHCKAMFYILNEIDKLAGPKLT